MLSSIGFAACDDAYEEEYDDDEEWEESEEGEVRLEMPSNEDNSVEEMQVEESASNETSSMYTDGTYYHVGTYNSPAGPEEVGVRLTVKDDIVTAVSIEALSSNSTSETFQEKFGGGISSLVNGVNLSEIENVSVVNGSSLTGTGFNKALAAIKADAAV